MRAFYLTAAVLNLGGLVFWLGRLGAPAAAWMFLAGLCAMLLMFVGEAGHR